MINLLYILAFTAGFALFDYFAYNEFTKRKLTNGIFAPYRIVQTCVQIILIAIAWAFVDLMVAIGFTLLWWTWVSDFMFHLYCFTDFYDDMQYVSKEFFGTMNYKDYLEKYFDEQQNEYRYILYWNNITWAWWTPYGLIDLLINGKDQNTKYFKIINWRVLAIQSFIGIILTLIISTW